MPFSFLSPWIWLGAVAVAAPLWLHLRRKKETNIHHFTAVRFLQDEPSPRKSPLRLRHLALLAFRVLGVLLVVGAFAWPYLRGANTVPIRESRVYILDNTLSHQTDDGFGRDRDRLFSDVTKAGSDLQVAVVELTSAPRVIVRFGEGPETARLKLAELRPSFQRGSYLAAFRQANALLANSLGEHKRIILLGDNQENQWGENVETPPFLRDVEVELPHSPTAARPNLSLLEPRAQRIFLGDKSLVNFTVKLRHVGPAESAKVEVKADGRVILTRSVELQHQPETILLQTQWEAEPGAWLRGEATVEGAPDALAGDNAVFFSLAPVTEGKVALLAQSPFLRLALSAEIMHGQWSTRLLEPGRLGEEAAAGQDADVLCLESSFLQSAEARKLLSRYLASGRGVLLVVNRLTPAGDGFLRELGFDSEGVVQAREENPERFQFVFSNHAIFHPFLSPDFGNLMDIRIFEYVRFRARDAMPLIFSENGAGLFFQGTKSAGKLFVAAFGFDREHSSWPIHPTFVPFLDLTLQAARAEDPTPTTFEPGEHGVVQLPAGAAAREVVLRSDQQEVFRGPIEQGRAQLRLPDHPGLYTLSFDDKPAVEKVLSVNPSPKESLLVYADSPQVVKTWQVVHPTESTQAAVAPLTSPFRLAGVLQQRHWWWMIMGGLCALGVEMALAGMRKEGS